MMYIRQLLDIRWHSLRRRRSSLSSLTRKSRWKFEPSEVYGPSLLKTCFLVISRGRDGLCFLFNILFICRRLWSKVISCTEWMVVYLWPNPSTVSTVMTRNIYFTSLFTVTRGSTSALITFRSLTIGSDRHLF